jgi:hypothetical protein
MIVVIALALQTQAALLPDDRAVCPLQAFIPLRPV